MAITRVLMRPAISSSISRRDPGHASQRCMEECTDAANVEARPERQGTPSQRHRQTAQIEHRVDCMCWVSRQATRPCVVPTHVEGCVRQHSIATLPRLDGAPADCSPTCTMCCSCTVNSRLRWLITGVDRKLKAAAATLQIAHGRQAGMHAVLHCAGAAGAAAAMPHSAIPKLRVGRSVQAAVARACNYCLTHRTNVLRTSGTCVACQLRAMPSSCVSHSDTNCRCSCELSSCSAPLAL